MIRVHVICEGQTEEMFIHQVLANYFISRDIYLYPSLIGKPGHKGGNFKFERLLTDLRIRLQGDPDAYCTTFFDFYGLPNNFPGKTESQQKINSQEKSDCLLHMLSDALKEKLTKDPLRRFIPYIQMHEFEALLFSDPAALAQGIDRNELERRFRGIREKFDSPEEINDNPETAPSKRIIRIYSEYDKPIHGSLAALEIGLDKMRGECPLFNDWLNRLEALA
ncbi:MAG: DUF4276 family protein [Desulfobacteraceae bacterium]|jgi:hypothetical protein|nr:DUF4276 family protein [Desulfobacteraceae bacterium]